MHLARPLSVFVLVTASATLGCRSTPPAAPAADGAASPPSARDASAPAEGADARSTDAGAPSTSAPDATDGDGGVSGTLTAPQRARRALADGLVRGAAMRADLPTRGGWQIAAPPSKDKVAGLVVRGPERALDPAALEALRALLRDDSGYDDLIAKRCRTQRHVGLRLYRAPSQEDEKTSAPIEIAIDFQCQKLFAVSGPPGAREVHATHFDPSRAAWLALARAALTGDAQVAKWK